MPLVRPTDLGGVIPAINAMIDQLERQARGEQPIVTDPKVLGAWIQQSGVTLGKLATSYSDAPAGYVVGVGTFSSPVSCTATTEATANTVVSASAFTADGSRSVIVTFYSPAWSCLSVGTMGARLSLYDGSSTLGILFPQTLTQGADIGPLSVSAAITPSAGSHTLSVRGWFTGTGTSLSVKAGTGGAGNYLPGVIAVSVY